MNNAIDISEWNGDLDFDAIRASGIDTVIIRCGFGQSGIDKYFPIYMEEAQKAGLKIGVYYYSYATDYDTAVSEAMHCVDLIGEYRDVIDLPVFYDVEEDRNVPRITDVCMGFINTMNYYGCNCGIYTTGSWYSSYFKDISTDYIWIAYWGADDGQPHNKPDYCDIWQYTSKGSVPGAGSGCVDRDIVYNEDMQLLIHQPEPPDEHVEEFQGKVTVTYKGNNIININIIKEDN